MSRRDPKVRLLHMRDYAQKAVAMIEGQARDDLDSDEKLRLALTHLVELIGEVPLMAARAVSPALNADVTSYPLSLDRMKGLVCR